MPDEPGHQELCDTEQAYMVNAIAEDTDLTRHMNDAVQSLAQQMPLTQLPFTQSPAPPHWVPSSALHSVLTRL